MAGSRRVASGTSITRSISRPSGLNSTGSRTMPTTGVITKLVARVGVSSSSPSTSTASAGRRISSQASRRAVSTREPSRVSTTPPGNENCPLWWGTPDVFLVKTTWGPPWSVTGTSTAAETRSLRSRVRRGRRLSAASSRLRRASRSIRRSDEPARDAAETREGGARRLPGGRAQHLRDGAGQHDVARPQPAPHPAERVGGPRERHQRVAEDLRRGLGRDDLAVLLENHTLEGEVEAGDRREGAAEHDAVGVDAVRDHVDPPRSAAQPEVDQLEGRHRALHRQQRGRGGHARTGAVRLQEERHLDLDAGRREARDGHRVTASEHSGAEQEAQDRLGHPVPLLEGGGGEAHLPPDHPLPLPDQRLLELALEGVGPLDREIRGGLAQRAGPAPAQATREEML